MSLNLPKKKILYFFVFIWLVFSVVYIVWDVWTDFKNAQMLKAYQQGVTDTINQIIQEAEKCQPIPIFSDEKKIQVISVDCLEKPVEQEK